MSKAFPFLSSFRVTSLYGYRQSTQGSVGATSSNHKGMDMVGISNINVVSCTAGIVVEVSYQKYRGNYVLVNGYDGFTCLYQHLASVDVKPGDFVGTKQKIGVMGSTGNVTGAHLHLEVSGGQNTLSQHNKATINPADYLEMQNTSTIKGKTFSGYGYISTEPSDVTSINNNDIVVTYSSQSEESSVTSGSGYMDILVPSGEYYEVRENTFVESDWLYGRRYRVFVELEANQSLDVSDLRCTFSISKTSYAKPNQSVIRIYNLNPDDENKIIKQGQRIIIEAGYVGSQYGKIFVGNVIQAIRSKENGTDYCLTLVSMDNDRYTAYGLVGVALVAEQSARDAVNALANKSVVKTEIGYVSQMNTVYPRGKVMFGMAKDYLAQLAASENASYYSDDGKINIVSASEQPPDVIKSYGPRNGLIGTPTQTEYGISCQILLDPSLKLGSFFHVDNQKITGLQYQQGQPIRSLDNQGIYRVITIDYSGDTRGNDWYMTIEAVSQAGMLPSMVTGSEFYGW